MKERVIVNMAYIAAMEAEEEGLEARIVALRVQKREIRAKIEAARFLASVFEPT